MKEVAPRVRMRELKVIAVASLLVAGIGCREVACDKVYSQSFWEGAAGVQAHMDYYRHILSVRIDENHAEDRGPNVNGVLHFKGTVERSWKGDWKASERISFMHYVDYQPSTDTSNELAGELLFVFTNDHTNAEIALGTGDFGYSTNIEQVLHCFFDK